MPHNLLAVIGLSLLFGVADRVRGGDYLSRAHIPGRAVAYVFVLLTALLMALRHPPLPAMPPHPATALGGLWGALAAVFVTGAWLLHGWGGFGVAWALWAWDGWKVFGGQIDPQNFRQVEGYFERHLFVLAWTPIAYIQGAGIVQPLLLGVLFALWAAFLGGVLTWFEIRGRNVNTYVELARGMGYGLCVAPLMLG